jgi:arylsulfatase A-like enzyme
MKKKMLTSTILAALTLPTLALAAPNVIVIVADDLGYGDVSYNGCPDYTTPNIDALAAGGVKLSNGYATHCFCAPSRAGLMTGRYQQRFGFELQPPGDAANPRQGIPASEMLLPQLLKQDGYRTGMVGKWHLGAHPNLTPLQRGFDEFFGFLAAQSPYYNASVLRGTTKVNESAYLTDAFTREAVSFINRSAGQPFMLYLAYNAPHAPYAVPPQNYVNQVSNIADTQRRTYAAMVKALDAGVGQVVQALAGNGVLSNTLIFFVSDNGAPLNGFTRNTPLRGGKNTVWDGGIHVPFLLYWSGHLAPRTYDSPVSSLDILPTAVAAAGVALPSDRDYDGFNLLPRLGAPLDRDLFWRVHGLGATTGPKGSKNTIFTALSGGWKLTKNQAPLFLADLSTDPSETTNKIALQPQVASELQARYDGWHDEMIAPVWRGQSATPIKTLSLTGDINGPFVHLSAPALQGTPDGFNWFTKTVRAGTDAPLGVNSVAIVGAAKQWGGTAIAVDGYTDVPQSTQYATITFPDTYHYSFRALNFQPLGAAPMRLTVMRTANAPVSVAVSGVAGNTVSASVSAPPSPQEQIYVRWTTDAYTTSHMVRATGSGTSYSASIPAEAGTTVEFCLVTTTVNLTGKTAAKEIDALTLNTSPSGKMVTQ